MTLPLGAVKYAQTPTFDETTIPKSLLANHSTKPTTWGLIVVTQGSLVYTRIDQPAQMLSARTTGVILPAELHKVAPDGCVKFHVEFYRIPKTANATRSKELIL